MEPVEMKIESVSEFDNKSSGITNGRENPKCIFSSNRVESEDDIPLSSRKSIPLMKTDPTPGSFEAALIPAPKTRKKVKPAFVDVKNEVEEVQKKQEDSEDDVPLIKRKRKLSNGDKKPNKQTIVEDEDDNDYSPERKKRPKHHGKKPINNHEKTPKKSETKRKKKADEDEDVWKWWEEEKHADGIRWKTLEHHGPIFAPPYEPLANNVHFIYDGKPLKLRPDSEEMAGFYAKMAGHDYLTKEVFNRNFFKDWRKIMSPAERDLIVDLRKCDFSQLTDFFAKQNDERKAMSKEEKLKIKQLKETERQKYGYALIDGHRQKIANFRIEPPGLFRGRGDHPRMGKRKARVVPEDVTINCSKKARVPDPPKGRLWKEVKHDDTVTWLCCWTENILNQNKYIMFNPSSKIKGEKDMEKFDRARMLKTRVEQIRQQYTLDLKAKEMMVRQRAVAMYFIDKFALRAGNEKEKDDSADTVGCCSLRCEHIELFDQKDDQNYVVEFDFLGKDSIRYVNSVSVEKRVFKNLQYFKHDKQPDDALFDRIDTTIVNRYLQSIMPGLTAKVFRTFNASFTLQDQLKKLTNPDGSLHDKVLSYNRANRQVAILCNHQRAVPKTHDKSMENLSNKIKDKKAELKGAKAEVENCTGEAAKVKARKKVERTKEQLKKLKIQHVDKDENKQIALGTSKLNYLDPRITVAWCRKYDVNLEKIYTKTQRDKFKWAIDMTDEDYEF